MQPQQLQTQKLDNILYQLSRVYRDQAKVRKDSLDLLNTNPSFQFITGNLPGQPTMVLGMVGTIPIAYKGARYHIPVSIYLPDSYPGRPPTVVVTPTQEMAVKQGHQHVDANGVVYLPYLSQWGATPHNLLGLCQEMSQVFSGDPPVRTVSNPNLGRSNSGSGFQVNVLGSNLNVNGSGLQWSSNPQPNAQPPPLYTNPPAPAPGYPSPTQQYPSASGYPPQGNYPPPTGNYPPPPSGNYPPPPTGNYQPPPSGGFPPGSYPPGQYNMNGSSLSRSTSYSAPPPPYGGAPSAYEDPAAIAKRTSLSQVRGKLGTKLETFWHSEDEELKKEQDGLRSSQQENQTRIDQIRKSLEALMLDGDDIVKKTESINTWLAKNDTPDINWDEISEPSELLRKQLLHAVAEEVALEDVIYVVDQSAGKMPLDDYLKYVRTMSRELFLCRAMIAKIQKVMRMPTNVRN